jgi:formamidopyrimidine-DNA glycosylase
MPELPEVETIARGLAKRVVGDVIESVWLGSKPEPLKSSAQEIATTLEGARIKSVRRVGKHIVFDLERPPTSAKARTSKSARRTSHKKSSDNRQVRAKTPAKPVEIANWIVHLGMTGQLLVCPPDAELAKHTHAIAKLASGRELRFVDPRRFGRLSVVRSQNGFETAGVEPLDVSFDAFVPLFRKRNLPMKSALLNQKLLRGVGNIYADESLFRAGIRPRRRAATLTREKLGLLYKSVQQVLQEAIAAGGSSISDYVGAEGEPGFFQMQHRVYGRGGEPCLNCGTAIKRIVIAGRSSHYCPHCQK